MELNVIDSLLKALQQKTKSPILGTIIIVWVIHHWELLIGLLFFNEIKTTEINSRIDWIKSYFQDINFYKDLFHVTFIALIALSVTYILISISKLLSSVFIEIVYPRIYKLFNSTKFILRESYNELIVSYSKLSNEYEEERSKRLALKAEVERLENDLTNERKKVIEINPTISQKINEKNQDTTPDSKNLDSDNIHKRVKFVLDQISKNGYLEESKELIENISVGLEVYKTDKITKFMASLGIIELDKTNQMISGKGTYRFTKFGEKIKEAFPFE